MKITSFQDDLLDLRGFSERLEKFIETEHAFVDGSLVIALNSKFGFGKSTFLRMWQAAIESNEGKLKPLVIPLNAWESDYNGDPLFAIVSALAEAVEKTGGNADLLVEAAKTAGWFATAIGSQIVAKYTGVDLIAAGELSKRRKATRREESLASIDAFSAFEGRRKAMDSLKDAIRGIVSSSHPRALFLVDELDRCRPDYAISYLETIKHLFDTSGAVFVLAADRLHLMNSAKTAFGVDLDFDEYYRKFVHRQVDLPEITDEGYERLAIAYVKHYLEREESRFCFLNLDRTRPKDISELIAALKLTPRQIQEVFRILGHLFDTAEKEKGRLRWGLGVASITMATLRVGDSRMFDALGSQNLDPVEASHFLRGLRGISHPKWWFTQFLAAGGLRIEEGSREEDIMERVGFISKDEKEGFRREWREWHEELGNRGSRTFRDIHGKILQLSSWTN